MSKLEEIENNWEVSGYVNDIEAQWLISRVKELEADLKLNSSMLAKQCDLAREAEARVKELEEILNRYKNAADGYIKI
jgi:hypothetical protein